MYLLVMTIIIALVERLSSVQREREKALATQLRTALEQKERLQHKLQQHGYASCMASHIVEGIIIYTVCITILRKG